MIRLFTMLVLCFATAGLATPRALAWQTPPEPPEPPESAGKPDPDAGLKRAREIFELLTSERFREFLDQADEKMKGAIEPEDMRQIWTSLKLQLGQPLSEKSARIRRDGDREVIDFNYEFEDGWLKAQLSLDKKRRMTAIWFDEVLPAGRYTAPDYVDNKALWEKPGKINPGGAFPLNGVLSIPFTDKAPFPCVVLVHGAGPLDRDATVGRSKPFRDLAYGLSTLGIAVYRYDKRSQVYPTAYTPEEWTLERETIEDAIAAVKLVKTNSRVDGSRVFVLGHSLGGVAAPEIAQNTRLAGMILMATQARSMLDLIVDQVEKKARRDGLTPVEKKMVDEMKAIAADVKAGKPGASKQSLLGIPAAYWAQLDRFEPVKSAKAANVPMLIMHGGRDGQVLPGEFQLWKRAFSDREDVAFEYFPAADHHFMFGKGPMSPDDYRKERHLDKSIVEAIANWVKATPPSTRPPDKKPKAAPELNDASKPAPEKPKNPDPVKSSGGAGR